jgi:type IV secretion system protein VirB4
MTPASTEQAKYVPWFAKAGAACSIVPIGRFVNDHIFALKGGGYGCLFALSGVDEEGLTDQELESQLRMIEGALRGLPEGAALYQYERVRSGYDLPRQQSYNNPVTHAFVCDRLEFLEQTAAFRRIDLHWCLTLEPSKVKAFDRRPRENTAATSRMLAELEKTATLLAGNLGSTIGLRLLDKQGAFQFFSYLFNLEDWAEWGCLRSDTGVDRQVVQNPVSWESDHLRIGRRYVQMYSLKTAPEASRPCLFADLLKLDCDSILCSTWRPKSTATARHEIDQQEKFISFFKVGVLSRVMAGKDSAVLPRNKYTAIHHEKPKDKQQAQRPEYKTCKFTTEAIITEGTDVGIIHKICANPSCPVHHPKQQASRNDEKWKAEQEKQRKEQAIANATGLRVLAAIGSAVPVRLLKRHLLFILEKLISVMDESRVEMLARQHGIRQMRDDGGVAKTLAAFLRRSDEGTLSRMLVESSILLAATRGNPSAVLKDAATAYKVDTDAIAAKVKQEFVAKEKARKTAQSSPKAAKKVA